MRKINLKIENIIKNFFMAPLSRYVLDKQTICVILVTTIATAIIFKNHNFLSVIYNQILNLKIGFFIGNFYVSNTLLYWTNNLIASILFFLVGLDFKKEILIGNLTGLKKIICFFVISASGIFVSAAIYIYFNANLYTSKGWVIPTVTDTALVIGILSFFKKKLPKNFFSLVIILSIFDDILAILIISIFSPGNVDIYSLKLAFYCFIVILFVNFAGFKNPFIYIAFSILLWSFIEKSGIHSSVSGLIAALSIPTKSKKYPYKSLSIIKHYISKLKKDPGHTSRKLSYYNKDLYIRNITCEVKNMTVPLESWKNNFEYPTLLIILPLFAFLNSGILLDFSLIKNTVSNPVFIGVFSALIIGKPVGLFLSSAILTKLKFNFLPKKINYFHITLAACIMGVGFTMSIFTTKIIFFDNACIELIAKESIFVSLIFIILVFSLLYIFFKKLKLI